MMRSDDLGGRHRPILLSDPVSHVARLVGPKL
jgi:hypothetical protein